METFDTITVNGASERIAPGSTVGDLIASMRLTSERVAIEVNGAIVVRSEHPRHVLQKGDVVEVVTFVGGG